MTIAYVLYGNDKSLESPAGAPLGQIFGYSEIEKPWLKKAQELVGADVNLKKVYLSELLDKKSEAIDYIFCYPALKIRHSELQKDFPQAKILMINEL